jgi:hypothetical protein
LRSMPRPETYLGSYGRNLCVTGEFTGAFSSRYRRACVRKHFPEYQEKMWSHNVGEPLVFCLLSYATLGRSFITKSADFPEMFKFFGRGRRGK